MTLQMIFDNNEACLMFHTDTKIVHHILRKDLSSEQLRNVLNTGNDLLKKNGATKWLSDNREIEPHSEEDTAWINTDWLPRAIAVGWKYWALVVPQKVIARMNMTEFVDSFYERGVRIMVFTKLDEAMDWLINVDKS